MFENQRHFVISKYHFKSDHIPTEHLTSLLNNRSLENLNITNNEEMFILITFEHLREQQIHESKSQLTKVLTCQSQINSRCSLAVDDTKTHTGIIHFVYFIYLIDSKSLTLRFHAWNQRTVSFAGSNSSNFDVNQKQEDKRTPDTQHI